MWMIATRFSELDTSGAEAMLALLGQKERDSNSISVRVLTNQAAAILGGSQAADQSARSAAYAILDYMDQHENLHLLRYEDFVAHRVDGLQSYLGFELRRDFKMPPKATRILRTGREGNWRSWFLAEDHDFFVAGEAAKFQRLGYTDERPSHVSTAIDADEVTGYVARVQAILNDPHRGARRGRRAKPQSGNL